MTPRSVTREQLEAEARALSRDDPARLAEALIESLEEDAEIETAWRDEVRRRIQELDSGMLTAISGDEVLAELDHTVE